MIINPFSRTNYVTPHLIPFLDYQWSKCIIFISVPQRKSFALTSRKEFKWFVDRKFRMIIKVLLYFCLQSFQLNYPFEHNFALVIKQKIVLISFADFDRWVISSIFLSSKLKFQIEGLISFILAHMSYTFLIFSPKDIINFRKLNLWPSFKVLFEDISNIFSIYLYFFPSLSFKFDSEGINSFILEKSKLWKTAFLIGFFNELFKLRRLFMNF